MATGERIYGPYPHRNRWKVIVIDGTGQRTTSTFPSEAAAQAAIDEARAELAGRQVSDAIAAYLDDCRERELRPGTIATTGHRLRSLLQIDGVRTGGLIADLTPARARRAVIAMQARPRKLSVAHRRAALAEAGTWARWCVARGWLRADPFAELKVPGKVRRGKAQLSIDHARTFGAKCLELVHAGDEAALAALLTLIQGCRASEVTDRVVGDVDDGGAILWIREAKTEAGNRRLEVPAYLRAPLLALCTDRTGKRRPAATPVFGVDRTKPVDRGWLYYHVHRMCRLAGVPEVCPQSLRGLHATLATLAGRTSYDVAAALGHESPEITKASYIRPGALDQASRARVFTVLEGGRS